jgi:peptidoglycan/xylan/chitin deacetylase (PgdA/CDA1 family)
MRKIIKISTLLVVILATNLSLLGISAPKALGVNIVSNPSVETTDVGETNPISWGTSSWGQLTPTFEYKTSGQDGSKSLFVNVANYVSGDAKWYFDPVGVKASTKYAVSDYYKSSVTTSLFAWVIDSANQDSYIYIGDAAASTDWKQATFTFTTPANATKISLFHVVSSNGYLWTDNFVMAEGSTTTVTDNVPNASVEQVSDVNVNLPISWNQQKWGTNNATFQYLNNGGHTGTRSLRVDITSYTNGDAKWYFDKQPAVTNVVYTVKDYYKSNVATRVVIEIEKTNGTVSYVELATAAASASIWAQYTSSFTMPADGKSFTIYHLLDKVGYLIVDDYSALYAAAPIIQGNIPNNSFEQSSPDGSMPLGWVQSNWGTNTPKFTYLPTGHTGTRSAEIQMSNYTDGDAKWYYEPQAVKAGSMLKFMDYYKSNITTSVVVMFEKADGSVVYQGLPQVSPSSEWAIYSATFEVPTGAAKMTVFHLVSANGYLIVDDYSVSAYTPQALNRPMLSITFDDGWEDNYTTVLPRLKKYNLKSTQFYATMYIQSGKEYQIKAFKDAGHEIGSHTITHADLTKLSPADLSKELVDSKKFIEGIVGTGVVKNFASPFGAYNDTVLAEIQKTYTSHRSVDVGYNSKDNFRAMNVRVQNVLSTTTAAEVQGWINRALQDNTWLVLVYHRVGANPGPYDTTPAIFDKHLQTIKNSGIAVVKYNAGLNEVKSQL